jgi:hypothetical protein
MNQQQDEEKANDEAKNDDSSDRTFEEPSIYYFIYKVK